MLFDKEVGMSLDDYCYWADLEYEWEHDDMYSLLVEKYGYIIHYNYKTHYYNIVHEDFEGMEFITQDEAIEYAYEHLLKE